MARLFWHGITAAAILLLLALPFVYFSANSALAAPAIESVHLKKPASLLPVQAGTLDPYRLEFQLAQTKVKTSLDVKREKAAKEKARKKPTKRRRTARKATAKKPSIQAPPPARKPEHAERVEGSGIILSASLVTGGAPLREGVVWTLEHLDGDTPPVVTTEAQPVLPAPAGHYRITAKLENLLQSVEVDIPEDKLASLELAFNIARLRIAVLPAEGTMPLLDARIRVLKIGVEGAPPVFDTSNADFNELLPAGIYRVEASHGLARTQQDIGLTAGADRKVELDLSVGYVRVRARPAPDQEPLSQVLFELLPADALEDAPKPLATMSGNKAVFTLPAGTYRVSARFGEASAFQLVNIASNEFNDIYLDLGAGQVVVTLDGLGNDKGADAAFRLTRHDGADGPSLVMSRTVASLETGLPVGSYTVEAELEDGRLASERFLIEPGVRTVLALQMPQSPPAFVRFKVGGLDDEALPEGNITFAASFTGDEKIIEKGQIDGAGNLIGADEDSIALAPGTYKITFTHEPTSAVATKTISVESGAKAELEVDLPIGAISLALSDAATQDNENVGETKSAEAEWEITGIDGKAVARHKGVSGRFALKPGEYVVTLSLGGAAHAAAISVEEGETTALTLPAN